MEEEVFGKNKSKLENSLQESIKAKITLLDIKEDINKSIKVIYKKIKLGGKVLLCGNGGSAADAQHLAAEFLVRLRPKVNRHSIPAMTLAQDTSTITACGNDYSYDDIFARNLSSLGSKKDILIVISTSGNSNNIIKALKEAKRKNIFSIGFLGCNGGKVKKLCDIPLIINHKTTGRIQESHIFMGHHIFESVEDLLVNTK